MAKRNDDIAPYERRQARKWTRVSDYVADADAHSGAVHWPKPGALPALALREAAPPPPAAKRRLPWVAAAAVTLTAALALIAGGAFERSGPAAVAARTSVSSGLVFGLCDGGGLTNCVASGDSFYLGGKTVRIANIEAPQVYGAACPREARLGRESALRLQALLNSGELGLARVPQDLDRYGLMLRTVSVGGRDAGQAMVASGLARNIGDLTRSWC